MLKNEDIICISSIDWDFIWQGHQEIMTRFARNGNRVLFVENTGVRVPGIRDFGRIKSRIANWKKGVHGIRKLEDNLYIYSPLVLPFPYLRIARLINRRLVFSVLFKWLNSVGFSEPVVWTFLPTGLTIDLIKKLRPKVVIYYCIDSFKASSKDARKIGHTEKVVARLADLVFATSRGLVRHCSQYNKKVYYFPFGVSVENFKRALTAGPKEIPEDMRNIKRPICGYIGGIHKWIDLDLVRYIAEKNPHVSFVFCGPVQTDISGLKDLANIIFLGQKETGMLPMYVRQFDVAIIPYRIAEYTNNVYPTKLNEYLSLGKGVVSTPLPEVAHFNKVNNGIVKLAQDAEEFSKDIRAVISSPPQGKEQAMAIGIAEKNSWSGRVEEMSLLIEEAEREKLKQRNKFWAINLSGFYRNAGQRARPVLIAAVVLYLVVFRTPLVWYLATPLEISDEPAHADAIVVLGAGVGESGKAGQGYQERVQTAVDLYNKELGGRILYSTG